MSNIFEQASRQAFRFPTARGELTTEQLWDLPLTSTTKPNLNDIALAIDEELTKSAAKSFVTTVTSVSKALTLKLDILKHIIKVKQEEVLVRQAREANATKRRAIMEALANKQADKINKASEEDLLAELKALDEQELVV